MYSFIISFIYYLFLIILQFVLSKYISFSGIYPNFILMFIVYNALNKGPLKGELTGFLYGLTWDILSTDIFGIRTLTFTIAGYLAGKFNKKLNKNQPLTQVIVMGICLIVSQFGISLIYIIMPNDINSTSFELTHFVWLSVIFNLVLTPFVFKILSTIDKKLNYFHN
ncbi:MAG: rod shape-determining protein MreD [Endomicrobiaceae bacterium]|nr:rod shape-determining protein MreD [Endomicrobiaceae bacterium]MDD3052946.1 rod shape-determining protein MreD [Endomicrobiaceae bacterium]MDD3922003.1 rod shape-determining protein MreD [Endomicrobiaceae bacterium]MDD5101669.1 rod shape-determining protein MreD [Endomicrobiaceae bacterium]